MDGEIWDRVETADGKKGFIERSRLTKSTDTKIYEVRADGGLNLRDGPDGNAIRILPDRTRIILLEKGKEKIRGYYWDKISTATGVVGYVARNYIFSLNNEVEEPKENEQIKPEEPKPPVENNNEELKKEADKNISEINEEKKIIRVTPKVTKEQINIKFGINLEDDIIKTGQKIKIKNTEYKISKLGDLDGNGIVASNDALIALKQIVGMLELSEDKLISADLDKNGIISSNEALKILKNTVGIIELEL